MKWFNKERTKNLLTFPVESFSLLNDGKTFVDKDSADFVAEMYAEGHSFFTYTSDSVDSLASCCYSGDTKVLIKDARGAYLVPISEVKHMKFDQNGFRIFNNGKWSKGSYVELPGRPLYEVTLTNGAVMKVTDNHRNNCFGGMKLTKDLTTSDYIIMNSTPVDTYPEADEHLTYEQGFAIGAFLGDGSMGSEYTDSNGTTCIYEVSYSLSESKRWIIPLLEKANKQFGGMSDVREGKMYNNVLPVRVSSKQLAAAIMRWTNWQRGIRSETKALNVDCVLQSIEFRKGIVDGWMATDGNMNSASKGNSVRGYSTSIDLIETMQAICTSLGYITTVSVDNRTEGPVFRGIQYNKNYPVYGLLKYANHKHTRIQKDTCIFRDNSYWFRVKSIKPLDRPETVYCFEMDDVTDDKFTLPNGIHNYNCRLRNGIQDNQFSYTLGAGGVSTGSKCVMTININRLVQNTHRAWKAEGSHGDFMTRLSSAVADQTELIHKYLLAINKIICDMRDHHMISIYDAGFIAPEKQYLTCGINGLVEGAEYLGIEPTDNDQYAAYVNAIMSPIFEINKRDKTRTVMFNTEMVPAENLGVKFAKWDKKDGYFVPRDCYNSYFYRVEDPTVNIIDKFRLHGSTYTGRLDGGQCKSGLRIKPDEPAQGCADDKVLTVNREECRAKPETEGVTTNGDECSRVHVETSTAWKRRADGGDANIGRDSLQSEEIFQCDICGKLVPKTNANARIIDGVKHMLCGKHYQQYVKHHRFLDSDPQSKIKCNTYEYIDDYVVVHVYKRGSGEELGSFKVDLADFDLVASKHWRRWKDDFYTGNLSPVNIARFLFGLQSGDKEIVDHINGDRTDNRRSNLRIADPSQNGANKAIGRRNNSGVAGVYWDRNRKRWAVEIRYYYQRIHLNRYINFEDACYVRYVAEQLLFQDYRSFRNDDVLLPYVSQCKHKSELYDYVFEKLTSVGFALQPRRALVS